MFGGDEDEKYEKRERERQNRKRERKKRKRRGREGKLLPIFNIIVINIFTCIEAVCGSEVEFY